MKGPNGIDLVEMPGDGIWVKKIKIIHQAVKSQTQIDGSDKLANEGIDSHFGAMANSLMGNGAVPTAPRALPAALPITNALAAPAPGPLAITFPGQGANPILPSPGAQQSLANAAPPPGVQPALWPGASPPAAWAPANPVSTPHHSWISC